MAKFKYHAFNEEGLIIKKFIIEEDIELAKDRLANLKLQIIRIKRVFTFKDLKYRKMLNEEMLSAYCGEIGIILDSGVNIMRGLEMLIAQTDDKSYEVILADIYSGVKKGLNLSMAMEKTGVFPDLLTDMVASGELSSHLTEILFSMEDFYAREASIKAKIKSASIYPIILLMVAVAMVIFFNFFVFSEMKTLFDGLDQLPALTYALISGLDYLNAHPFIVGGSILAFIVLIRTLLGLEYVRYIFDKTSLAFPVFGQVKMNIITSRVASSMAIFIKSAVPLVKILDVVKLLVANKYVSEKVSIATEEIKRGRSIADAFDDADVFEPMLVQMIRVGEETGKLEEMLFRLASIYEKKTEIGIKRLVSLIEPIFTLVVGIVVAVIIIAMALPIFDMSSMIN